ncbi:hypothetical protein KKF91_06850 [Myxococcota bacterium]|nr:hypothetical protein [Myxococcota bacterium]
MEQQEQKHEHGLHPFLWAFLAPPLWSLLVWVIYLGLGEGVASLPALVLGTLLILRINVPVNGIPQLRPVYWRLLLPALIAGIGVTMLASELGNIWALLSPPEPLPEGPSITPPWIHAFEVGLLLPVSLTALTCAVTFRSLAQIMIPQVALLLSAAWMASWTADVWPQWFVFYLLPLWLYEKTGSLSLALAAFFPTTGLSALEFFGVQPGIPGFDVTIPNEIVWQPVWFDALGGLLLLVGMAPIINALVPLPEPKRREG